MGVFLAPKVPLVQQQGSILARHVDVRVKTFCGQDAVYSDVQDWQKVIQDTDLLVMTPQLLVNLLISAILPGGISALDIIVMDEAHHCRKKHPYNIIMEYYRAVPAGNPKPHIFGMSAAPAVARPNKDSTSLIKSLKELERNLDSTVVTLADRTELEKYVSQPKISTTTYTSNEFEEGSLLKLLEQRLNVEMVRLEIATLLSEYVVVLL